MRRSGLLRGAVVAVGLLVVALSAHADFSNWKWNAGDLNGTNSVQKRADELDNRLGGTGTVAFKRAVLGSSDTVQYVEWMGTCTNNQTVTITEPFTSATGVNVQLTYIGTAAQLVDVHAAAATTVTTNGFVCVGYGTLTNYYRIRGPGVK